MRLPKFVIRSATALAIATVVKPYSDRGSRSRVSLVATKGGREPKSRHDLGDPVIPDICRDTARTEHGWGWTFIDLAALGINTRRSYFIALLRIVFYPLAFSVLVGVSAAFVFDGLLPPLPIVVVVATFGSIIATGIAVVRSVTLTHRRPWLSLVSPRLTLDWRRLAIGAGVQAILIILTSAVLFLTHFITDQPLAETLPVPLPVLALALLLTPLQAASEEILFRGYLTQAFGRIFRRRSMIVVTVGMIFAVLHLNAYGPLTIPYMFALSLMLSLATLRDDRIELAIGAHTAWNWLGVGWIDSLVNEHTAFQITWPYLLAVVFHGILFYGLTRLLVRLACDRRA